MAMSRKSDYRIRILKGESIDGRMAEVAQRFGATRRSGSLRASDLRYEGSSAIVVFSPAKGRGRTGRADGSPGTIIVYLNY